MVDNLFGKKKSESFDSCCSGLDDHLNHHRPSHPQVHPHLHHHQNHLSLNLNGSIGIGLGTIGNNKPNNPTVAGLSESKTNTSTRSSTGTSSCGSRRKMSRWDQPEANHSTGSLLSTMQRFVQTVDDMNETILVPCRLMDLKFDEKEKLKSTNNTAPTNNVNDPKGHLMTNLNGVDLFQFYAVLNSVKNDLMWGSKPTHNNSPNNTSSNGHHHPHHHPHHHGSTGSSISSSASSTSSASSVSSTSMVNNSSSVSLASSVGAVSSTHHNNSSTSNGEVKGHVRRPSTVSTNSSASASDTGSTSSTTIVGVSNSNENKQNSIIINGLLDNSNCMQEFSELNEDSGVEGEEEYSQQMSDSFHHHLNGLQHCLRELTLAADYITTRYNSDLGSLNI